MSSTHAIADVGAHRTPAAASLQQMRIVELMSQLTRLKDDMYMSFNVKVTAADYIRELDWALKPLRDPTEEQLLAHFVATGRLVRRAEQFIADVA